MQGSRIYKSDHFVQKQLKKAVSRLILLDSREKLIKLLEKFHPNEIVLVLPNFTLKERKYILEILFDLNKAGDTLSEFPAQIAGEYLSHFEARKIVEICRHTSPDKAADLLGYLSEEKVDEILTLLGGKRSKLLERLVQHEETTAGGLMTTEYLSVEEDKTVKQALEIFRAKKDIEVNFYLYIVDARNHLIGVVSLRELVLSEDDQKLGAVMNSDVIRINADMPQEEVALLVTQYNMLALPVVDDANKLVGVITVDDVIDVIQEEATEDFYKMAGLEKTDRVFSSPFYSIKKRLPWLMLNMMTALLAATVVGLFQDLISAFVILAVFMPVVAGMGGNAGTQAITVIVRGMALGELRRDNAMRAFFKEVAVGIFNGFCVGTIMGLMAYLLKGNPVLGLVVGLALVINLFVAALVGTLVPLGLKRLKFDPAIASSIFVTTATDVCGFFSFLGLAKLFWNILVQA